jgi:hypothetical protein
VVVSTVVVRISSGFDEYVYDGLIKSGVWGRGVLSMVGIGFVSVPSGSGCHLLP